ncbi:MAG: right-handed parallel beta-helix repeat-containing protein [Deltaproteobacteria bacterium]|nr:right-handed parallel beta-helix repeat-containing protein [Deltaproteobacteria bacterium]MBN2670997.1 right-handed parallel beta-helix repeat-containing protein [Deltaproteobacteria bacterium]
MALHTYGLPERWFCALIFIGFGCSTVVGPENAEEEPTPSVDTYSMDMPTGVQQTTSIDESDAATRTADSQSDADKDKPDASADPNIDNEISILDSCSSDLPNVIYVDAHNIQSQDGLSWQTAYSKIQPAIDTANAIAAKCGRHVAVWVKAGHYYLYEADAPYGVLVREKVHLYGGFTGNESTANDREIKTSPTILDARANETADLRLPHVAVLEDASVLDGVVLTGGYAGGTGLAGMGGALMISNASVQLRNVNFIGNVSALSGGAVVIKDSDVSIENCHFESNFTDGDGGAVHAENATIACTQSTFLDNRAAGYGGAVVAQNTTMTFEKNIFTGNNATGGGAVSAGESTFTATNSLFADNTGFFGGAVYLLNYQILSVLNCTFADNYAQDSGASLLLEIGNETVSSAIVNSIFAGGYPNELALNDYADGDSEISILWNAIEGGYAGEGNIDAAPIFEADSYMLTEGSPCVNAALDEMAPHDDINGKPRTSADMGAYEL